MCSMHGPGLPLQGTVATEPAAPVTIPATPWRESFTIEPEPEPPSRRAEIIAAGDPLASIFGDASIFYSLTDTAP